MGRVATSPIKVDYALPPGELFFEALLAFRTTPFGIWMTAVELAELLEVSTEDLALAAQKQPDDDSPHRS